MSPYLSFTEDRGLSMDLRPCEESEGQTDDVTVVAFCRKTRKAGSFREKHLLAAGGRVLVILGAIGWVLPLCGPRGRVPVVLASTISDSPPARGQIGIQIQLLVIPEIV